MRIGKNPVKEEYDSYQCKKIGIAILTYIPNEIGYFSNSFEILKIQIESIKNSINTPADILLFDNGSNKDIQRKLSEMISNKQIDFLFLSNHNLGKTGALNWIFSSMQNEFIVYTDSDILFRQGWLEESLNIFNEIPTVGLVTAQPCLYDILNGKHKTTPPKNDEFILVEKNIEFDIIEEYINGLGKINTPISEFTNKKYLHVESKNQKISCIFGGSHMQFLTKKQIISKILPLPAKKALSKVEDFELNNRLDQLGYLQLSLTKPLVYHMGNSIDEIVKAEQEKWNQQQTKVNIPIKNNERLMLKRKKIFKKIIRSLNKNELISRFFKFLYMIIFEINSE